MKTKTTKLESQKNLNQDKKFSKTGYRALLLLTKLMKSPMSKESIEECFYSDKFVGGLLSTDTITNTINVLRSVGCKINRPSAKTNYCYVLESHPFSSFLTDDDVSSLLDLRENITSLYDWELVIKLNNFYKKIAKYTCNTISHDALVYNHCLKNIDIKMLKTLITAIDLKKELNLLYNSPIKGNENIEFLPEKITFESGKLYLWGYFSKYNQTTYLKVERIKNINLIKIIDEKICIKPQPQKNFKVVYKLKGLSAITYIENEKEKILKNEETDEYKLTIEASVTNKFNFYQKILSYGADCKIVSPKQAIKELKKEVSKIKTVYKNAK